MKHFIIALALAASAISIPNHSEAAQADPCQPIKNFFKSNAENKAGICRMHFTRTEPQVILKGYELSPDMVDLALNAHFQQTGNKAEVVGEFALLGEEVNPVADALRKGGIEITAIHNHLIGEQPTIYYLHFEGMGKINTLAKTVKAAVDKVSYQ